jgi:hypothetical protein
MAAGDTKLMGNYIEAMANNTLTTIWSAASAIKVGLITSSTTPSVNDSFPTWGAGGTQNYSTNEVAAGGNYSAGGATLAGCTVVQTNNVVALNATSPITWAANASNPTNARWLVIYNNTTTNKEVLGYIDLGGTVSLVPGLQINLNGVGSGTQPVFNGTATP